MNEQISPKRVLEGTFIGVFTTLILAVLAVAGNILWTAAVEQQDRINSAVESAKAELIATQNQTATQLDKLTKAVNENTQVLNELSVPPVYIQEQQRTEGPDYDEKDEPAPIAQEYAPQQRVEFNPDVFKESIKSEKESMRKK